jgi:hypothetical protein
MVTSNNMLQLAKCNSLFFLLGLPSHLGERQIQAALLVHMQIVPKGLFQEIAQLKTLDLSHNAIKTLPEEIAALKCVGNSKGCLPAVWRQLADARSVRR